MAVKNNTRNFVCIDCQARFSRWEGRCSACGNWNTIEERAVAPKTKGLHAPLMTGLGDVARIEAQRISTGVEDLDMVLGGGLVPGSLVLIAGEPGVGKSTLLLELARAAPGKLYYFSGEESVAQIALRADRMGLNESQVSISHNSDVDGIVSLIRSDRPAIVLIDSIQTANRSTHNAMPGMVGQLKESTMLLLETAKSTGIPIVMTGHTTKDGNVAGPRMLEHMVDTVLYFERDRLNQLRMLRAIKNRFGPVGEVGLFHMRSDGLEAARAVRPEMLDAAPGRVCSVLREGSRSLVVEVQALVTRNPFGPTRRMAEGLDNRRLMLIAAVLEKTLKMRLAECDVFANLAGGLTGDEPALDLAIAAAILSSYREEAIEPDTAFIGEVGLAGEVRPVPFIDERIAELRRQGFRRFFVPGVTSDEKGCVELRNVSKLLEGL